MNIADDQSSPSASGSINLNSQDAQKTKKRRLHGACDTCRKRKIKCDSAEMSGTLCTNCQISNIPCTHDVPRQPKKKETQQAYIQSLEERLERMEKFLHQIHPEKDIDLLIGTPEDEIVESSAALITSTSFSSYSELRRSSPPTIITDLKPPTLPEITDDPSEAEDLAHIALAEHLSQLSMDAVEDRFFGQSSGFMMAKHALTVKNEATGTPNRKLDPSKFRRPLFWDIRPWEKSFATIREPAYVYPEEDLLQSLVSIYFEKANTSIPILHRQTFLKSLSLGQHLWDPSFGMTVLLVCAVASRYSRDPRVCIAGDASGLSSGWQYFCQVPIHRNPLLYRSTVYDLQYYTLAIIYLIGTSIPHAAWNILGLGIRYALEKGTHRRKRHSEKPTVEEELLKRAFWSLISIDRVMSSFLGRPCAIQDEDFDVEYPIECDDEYWETEDPEQAFKQPPGKPCKITSFVCHLKLCEMLAFTLRTLYSTKKSKILSGLIGNEWEHRIVAELDSSMNQWKDSLPHFLRWSPEMTDPTFFHQSVCLHATFYYLQIQIHRPFLTKKSALSLPSLAMCTNAARSCCHILEAAVTRGIRPYPNIIVGSPLLVLPDVALIVNSQMAAYASGIVILLNLWGSKRSGLIDDPAKEMANVQKCMNVLKECEKRWHIAGCLLDMLKELGSFSEYQPTAAKRRRDSFSKESNECQNAPFPAASSLASSTVQDTPALDSFQSIPLDAAVPTFDTAATMPTNDWDLSNLLMVQMGYIQPDMSVDNGQQFAPASTTSFTPGNSMAALSNIGYAGAGYASAANNPLAYQTSEPILYDEILSLWSDIPVAFSLEEWDAYLLGHD